MEGTMVRLTRMNGKPLVINALMIEMMEETPDTVITLINGKKLWSLNKRQWSQRWWNNF